MSFLAKWGRVRTIRNRIFFSILLFLVVPVILTFYFMDKPLERVIERKIGLSAQDALHLINVNVGSFLEEMLQSSVNVSINPEIKDLLKNPDDYSNYEKLRLNDKVLNRAFSSAFTSKYVTLFDLEGNWLSTSYIEESLLRQYLESDWYRAMMQRPFRHVWMFNYKSLLYKDRKPIITLAKTITDTQTTRNIGMIVFSVAEEDIRKHLAGLAGEVFLVDRDGTIVSGSATDRIGQSLSESIDPQAIGSGPRGQAIVKKEGRKWIVNYDTVALNGWKIVQLVPYDTVFKEIFAIRRANVLIFLLILTLFTMITLTISYGISKPLKLLKKRMRELENKGFHSAIPATGPLEIASLIETYNKMVKEIRVLLTRVKEEYEQKEEMRFRALQAQINPHFILNTLNNIKWMAYIRNNPEIGDMLSSLGGILEESIGRGGSLVPLRQEIAYIENYLSLMKIKYLDKLGYDIDVPEACMDQEVVKIMLQPIVENSILHGIDPLTGSGRISIGARYEENRFVLVVRDNGVGMAPDRLEGLLRQLHSGPEAPPPQRIGVKNVYDRLKFQYGERFDMRIASRPDEGTTVEFTLPNRKAEADISDEAEGDAG